MYLTKTPGFIQSLFPTFLWKIPTSEKKVFLTFDDGPIPGITPWVLDQLDSFGAKATFFCVGENIEKYPEIFNQILKAGHDVGNHTHNHLSGWSSDNLPYFHNIRKCARLVNSDLFRPPYGKMKPSQAQFLQRHYQIVMWDVLSGDFDKDLSGKQCLNNVMKGVKPGSIVVFHDSIKAMENMKFALPRALESLSDLGYSFHSISSAIEAVPAHRHLAGQLS